MGWIHPVQHRPASESGNDSTETGRLHVTQKRRKSCAGARFVKSRDPNSGEGKGGNLYFIKVLDDLNSGGERNRLIIRPSKKKKQP